MVEAYFNITDELEISEEEMLMYLSNQAFNEQKTLEKEESFTLLHAEDINNQSRNIKYLIWSCYMTRKVSQYMPYKSGFHWFVSCIWNCKYHKTLNSYFVSLVVAPCIVLRWLVYPCRYCDMITRFGISV